MIQEFKIKNVLSFRDEVTFSFEATKDTTFEDYQVVEVAPGVRLLRLALVYGANASGKSNLLKALNFLMDFWFANQEDMDKATNVIPFLLDINTPNEPSLFELKFYVDDVCYWYQLKLDKHRVYEEKLYYFRNVQPTLLFNRLFEHGQSIIEFNPVAVKVSPAAQEEITLKCLPNMSFFAARNKVNVSIPIIDEARDWMRTCILPLIEPKTQMSDYAGRKMWEDKELEAYMLDFAHKADFNITGVNTDQVVQQLPPSVLKMFLEDESLPVSEKERLRAEGTIKRLRTEFEHTVKNERGVETYSLPHSFQSEGTRRTLGVEAAIYQAIQKGAFLPVDEIESSLHPDLIEFILGKFLKEKCRSQLLITSHYDPLLGTIDDLIRKDSVWFTEKNEAGNTELYSLVDFKELNDISSFRRSYRNGVFGALPNIKG
jgi:AAA15 family ATPase/GTPase